MYEFKVILGTSRSARELKKALKEVGIRVQYGGAKYVDKMQVSHEKRIVSVVILPLSDLGIERPVHIPEIVEIAEKLGYERCTTEAVIQLALQYRIPRGLRFVVFPTMEGHTMYIRYDVGEKEWAIGVYDQIVAELTYHEDFLFAFVDLRR